MFRKWANNPKTYFRSILKGNRWRVALIVMFCLVIVMAGGVLLFGGNDGGKLKAADSCTEANREVSTIVNNAVSPDDFDKAYEALDANTKTCKPSGGILGIGADDSKDRLEKLQYHHKKATVGASIGKQDEAKKAAEQGLAIDKQLSSEEKGIDNYSALIQDLKWVMEGTY